MADVLEFNTGDIDITVPIRTEWQTPEARMHGRARPEIVFDVLAVTSDSGFEGVASLASDSPWILLPDPATVSDGEQFQVHLDTEVVRQAGEALTGHVTATKAGYDDGTLTITVATTPERRA